MTHNAGLCRRSHTHKHAGTHTHVYILLAYMLLHWVSSARGGELVPMLPTKTPLRFPQGRHVQLAVPTSVQNGLKTGMREACLRCLTLARRPRFWEKNDCYSRHTTAWMMHTCGVVHVSSDCNPDTLSILIKCIG